MSGTPSGRITPRYMPLQFSGRATSTPRARVNIHFHMEDKRTVPISVHCDDTTHSSFLEQVIDDVLSRIVQGLAKVLHPPSDVRSGGTANVVLKCKVSTCKLSICSTGFLRLHHQYQKRPHPRISICPLSDPRYASQIHCPSPILQPKNHIP